MVNAGFSWEHVSRCFEKIMETQADRSVEIGVFGGRGTVAMAIAHQMIGRGHVTGIDPWEAAASVPERSHRAPLSCCPSPLLLSAAGRARRACVWRGRSRADRRDASAGRLARPQ